jgi:FG-GAP-like repeat
LPDVVLTRISYPTAHVTHPVGIFLANGHGCFRDGSSLWSGPPARTEFGRQIIIADFNGDHRNDIFVADHGYDAPPFPGHPNTVVLSTPDGKLVDASADLPPESGFSHSATAADVNGDGSLDADDGRDGRVATRLWHMSGTPRREEHPLGTID